MTYYGLRDASRIKRIIAAEIPEQGPPERTHHRCARDIVQALLRQGFVIVSLEVLDEAGLDRAELLARRG